MGTEAASETSDATNVSAAPPPPSILVVDDESDVVRSMCDYLSHSLPDATCRGATSGAQALELLDREPVDLVISDYKMPGMDGLAFLREARQRRPGVACVLVTAYPDLDLAIRAVNEVHVSAFVTKPLRPTRFTAAVEEILRSHREAETLATNVHRSLSLADRHLAEAETALSVSRRVVELALVQVRDRQ